MKNLLSFFEQLLDKFNNLINLIAFILAIVAFILSYYQGKKMSEQAKRLTEINEKIPTQTIPSFPGNLVTINDKVLDASYNSNELLICSDVPAYGFLSNYPDYLKYEKNLINILNNSGSEFKLHFTTYSDSLLRLAINWQFNNARDTIVQYFKDKDYYKIRNSKGALDSLDKSVKDFESFQEFIIIRHNDLLKKLESISIRKVVITRLDNEIPFFMWIDSSHKIVISFPNYSQNVEHAFYSIDSEIIKNFRDIFFLIKHGVY